MCVIVSVDESVSHRYVYSKITGVLGRIGERLGRKKSKK